MQFEDWDWVTPEPTQAKVSAGELHLPLVCVQDGDGSWGVRDRHGWWLAGWFGSDRLSEKDRHNAIMLCHVKYGIPFEEK